HVPLLPEGGLHGRNGQNVQRIAKAQDIKSVTGCVLIHFRRTGTIVVLYRGSYCVGYSFEQRLCTSSHPCGKRVDGGWSEWGEWTDCAESVDGEWSAWNEWSRCVGNCGLGSRTRVRACVSPPSSYGGVPCFGKSFEIEECQSDDVFCSRFLHYADILDVQVLQSLQ
ncbi:thrombospondin type 1 domain protein, partial [Necator americanus]